jgi:8-oxo-dGTP diphosphatase
MLTAENNMETHERVGVIIVRADDKVLLGQRKGSHGAGHWGFPGGHPEPGEDFFACAKRETLEETGLELRQLYLGPVTRDLFAEKNRIYMTQFIIARYASGEPAVKEPDKCAQWQWFAWSDLATLRPHLFKPIDSLLKLGGVAFCYG